MALVTESRSESYHPYLIERLKDSQQAEAYIKAVLKENDSNLLRKAIRNVIEAGNNSVIVSLASDIGKITPSEKEILRNCLLVTSKPEDLNKHPAG